MSITDLTISERLNFLSTLALKDDNPKTYHLLRNNTPTQILKTEDAPSAHIDAGSVVSFTSEVSAEHASAVLNTALLAQLNSDKSYNRFDQNKIMDWYKNYQKVLGMCGWTIQDFQFQNYEASGSTFSVNQALLDLAATFLSQAELNIVKAALSSLAHLRSDDPWYTVWDINSHNENRGNFQVASASDTSGNKNTLVLKISGYTFQTTEITTKFLWEIYHSSNTKLSYTSQAITLNEDVYDKVKDIIIEKLGNKAVQNINSLDI